MTPHDLLLLGGALALLGVGALLAWFLSDVTAELAVVFSILSVLIAVL